MGRLCERPGCSDVAAMAYGFDADRLLVWIAPRDPESDPLRAGSLCLRHADAMVVPRGWTLDDRRESPPRLFRAPAPAEAPSAPRPRRAPRPTLVAVEPLPLTPPPVPPSTEDEDPPTVKTVSGASGVADPDATAAFPWLPATDEEDDLGGVLAADSPLLARAFRGTDRPR